MAAPMRVVFDHQVFYLQKYGGISRYFYELANELNKINGCEPKIVAPFQNNAYLAQHHAQPFIFSRPLLKPLVHNAFYNKTDGVNAKIVQQFCNGSKTILHETYYTHRVKTRAPRVITIHDMIYELFNSGLAEEKTVIAAKKQAIIEADHIIAVSENTRKDLLSLYPEAKNKTSVVYHGVDQNTYPTIQPYQHSQPFLLHVGNRGWYKNFEALLQVYGQTPAVSNTHHIICFGGGPVTAKEQALIEQYKLQQKVYFISGNDTLLLALYKAAAALAYISTYEGFGMPVLEAMALQCPVLAANTSSLPEVCGNAALSIDPKNGQQLQQALQDILFDEQLRRNLINLGTQRAAEFTWQRCAQQTFNLYKQLL